MSADQYSDWTLDDIDIKGTYFPNWLRAGFNSRSEAIEGILSYMKQRQGLFDRLGLVGPIIKREKKKK